MRQAAIELWRVTCRDPLPATGTGNRQFGGGRTLQADKATELYEDPVTAEIHYTDLTGHQFKVPASNVVCVEYEDPRAAVAQLPPEPRRQAPVLVRATPFVPEHNAPAPEWTHPQAAAEVAAVAPQPPPGPPMPIALDPRSPYAAKRRLARKDAGLVQSPNAQPVAAVDPGDVGPDLADMMAYEGESQENGGPHTEANWPTVPAPRVIKRRRTRAQMAEARAAGTEGPVRQKAGAA
jgi:hypothetical protein